MVGTLRPLRSLQALPPDPPPPQRGRLPLRPLVRPGQPRSAGRDGPRRTGRPWCRRATPPRSPTWVGSAEANAADVVVRGAAGERAIVSAIASHRSRISASGERSRIGREPGTARACAVGGNTVASSRSQLRSAGSSGPARQTSVSSAPTVGKSRPRATRPTPAAAAAAQTRALRRIGRPACSSGPRASKAGRASASGMRSAETRRLRMPYVPPGKTSSSLADPEPLPQSANTPRRGISLGTKTSSPSSTAPYDTGSPARPSGTSGGSS